MIHLVVDISAHGFGHAAMTLPVLDALCHRRPGMKLTIRTGLSRDWIAARMDAAFAHVAEPVEFGMCMVDSLRVLPEETLAAYQCLHSDWEGLVETQRRSIAALAPDLLVANVSYLALAGAAAAGVPSLAYSSLNWADVFLAYCRDLPGATAVHDRMTQAYATAELFIQPAPAMPMPSISRGLPVGPVARIGNRRCDELRTRLGVGGSTRLVLVSMGGISTPIDFEAWPRLSGLHVITGGDEHPSHPNISSWSDLSMPFIDVLASSDVLIAKPGYGLFVEGVCNGIPLLHIPRAGWPETDAEIAWLSQHGRGGGIAEGELRRGEIAAAVTDILLQPPRPTPALSGIDEVATLISDRL